MNAREFLEQAKPFLNTVRFAETEKHPKYPNCLIYKGNPDALVVGDCANDEVLNFVSFIITNFPSIYKIIFSAHESSKGIMAELNENRRKLAEIKHALEAIATDSDCFGNCGLLGHTPNCTTLRQFIGLQ